MTNNPQVTIYSTTWCAFCKTEKQYLEKLGVAFTEKDIETDEAAHAELMEKINGDFRGVPVTIIGNEVVLGFDRPKIDTILKAKNLVTA